MITQNHADILPAARNYALLHPEQTDISRNRENAFLYETCQKKRRGPFIQIALKFNNECPALFVIKESSDRYFIFPVIYFIDFHTSDTFQKSYPISYRDKYPAGPRSDHRISIPGPWRQDCLQTHFFYLLSDSGCPCMNMYR